MEEKKIENDPPPKKSSPEERIYCYGSAECDQFLMKNGGYSSAKLYPIPYFARNSIRIS